jgi:hypothetical protein
MTWAWYLAQALSYYADFETKIHSFTVKKYLMSLFSLQEAIAVVNGNEKK